MLTITEIDHISSLNAARDTVTVNRLFALRTEGEEIQLWLGVESTAAFDKERTSENETVTLLGAFYEQPEVDQYGLPWDKADLMEW